MEIKYFRSIYGETLNNVKDLTIFFGRNDSGKSNFLRALNLFFNGETNPGVPFLFERDMCHARTAEAESKKDARKFVSIKLFFSTPENWKKSLGTDFYVKKTWSATREQEPNFESSIPDGKKRIYLSRFLKQIRFHYIPAVKDRRIFDYLLGEVYAVLAGGKEFSASLDQFSTQLKERTLDLNSEITRSLKINSIIAPPLDLLEIFRSLDFETTLKEGDKASLTLQRGDGLQMRHIPAILGFISDKSTESFHLWGFEEPENSLELAAAVQESDSLYQYSKSHNKQLFVTSHSPAFFGLKEPDVDRYFVKKDILSGFDRDISRTELVNESSKPDELMGEIPHLAIISDRLSTLVKERDEIKALARSLKIKETRPVLFVEGQTDKIVIEAAWRVFQNSSPPFDVSECDGTTKMSSLAADGPILRKLVPEKLIFVLVDNDQSGKQLYKNSKLDSGGVWVQHNSNLTYWCRLRPTTELVAEMKTLGIPENYWPTVLENCFAKQLREKARNEGRYSLSETPYKALLQDVYKKVAPILIGDDFKMRLNIFPIDDELKLPFAEWVVQESRNDPSVLEPFRVIIDGIAELIQK